MSYCDAVGSDETEHKAGEVSDLTMEERMLLANGITLQEIKAMTPLQRGQIRMALADGQLQEGADVGSLGIAMFRDPNAISKAVNPAARGAEEDELAYLDRQAEEAARKWELEEEERRRKMMNPWAASVAAMGANMDGLIQEVETVSHSQLFDPSHGHDAQYMLERQRQREEELMGHMLTLPTGV